MAVYPGQENFNKLYEKLNKNQKIAVDALDGPVLVIAGPGTGKTQVLTMRIANILMKTDTKSSEILALTFTDSGVRAMRERLATIIGTEAYHVNVFTFHSFATEIIRDNPDEFINSSELEPLSDLERISIFKELIDENPFDFLKPFNAPYYYLQTIISKIKELKREGVSPNQYEEILKMPIGLKDKDFGKNDELLRVYRSYESKLIERKRYDFEDMINLVSSKLKTSPALLQKYQELFQYYLVDEFQDTNSAQAGLLYTLTSYWEEKANIFVVGDDDQSIYRFQGASTENIEEFVKRYPNAEKVSLIENYRSNQDILDASFRLIENNTSRISKKYEIDKKLLSKREKQDLDSIKFAEFNSSHTENYYIAQTIKDLINKGVDPKNISVIYRNNNDSLDIADMLSRFGIKYNLIGGANVLESGIILRLLTLLNVINKMRYLDESLDLFTLLNYEFLNLNRLDVLKISRAATERKKYILDILEKEDLKILGISEPEKFKNIYEKLAEWNKADSNLSFLEFIEEVITDSGFFKWILDQSNSYELLNKLNSFLSEVKRLNYSDKTLNLSKFMQYIELMKEHRIPIDEEDMELSASSVNLMTAHKSKGLEFEYVFVPYFLDSKWSNTKKKELIRLPENILITTKENNQIEEERRLFYVVLTRAKKSLYITTSKNYITASSSKITMPCMFIQEIPNNYINPISVEEIEKNSGEIIQMLLKKKDNSDVTPDAPEREYLSQVLSNFKLSPTSLNTYLSCPYKFKLDILFRSPKNTQKPLVLGNAVHDALENAYKLLKNHKPVSLDFLNERLKNYLEKEILSTQEFEEIRRQGEIILKKYYELYREEFDSPKHQILFLEKFFGTDWNLPILDGNILLQGKIDKVELVDSMKRSIRLVDYKTGKPKTRNEILGKTQNSNGDQLRQLIFYKLLIDLDKNSKFEVDSVMLDFIGDKNAQPKREVFLIQDEDTENLKNTIREVWSDIHNHNFLRTKKSSECRNCRFNMHCWPDGIPTASEEETE